MNDASAPWGWEQQAVDAVEADTTAPTGFNWDQQIGVSLTDVSDIYTLGVRTISGATTGDGVGSLAFYDLTQ